jgi:hypothetical protein
MHKEVHQKATHKAASLLVFTCTNLIFFSLLVIVPPTKHLSKSISFRLLTTTSGIEAQESLVKSAARRDSPAILRLVHYHHF